MAEKKGAPGADAKSEQKNQNQQPPKSGKVVALPTKCLSENCTKKPEVANFCDEHFTWFKEGLLTKEGKRPSDFDKKLVNFLKRKKAA